MRSKLPFALTLLIAIFSFSLSSNSAHAASTSTSCLPGSLKSTLHKLRKRFGRIQVISTHRPGAVIAGSGRPSYHSSCRAVDFNPPKGKYNAVVAWLKKNHRGGVGTYSCGMHHIHIDSGPKVKWHKCQGSGGNYYAKRKRYKKKYYGYGYGYPSYYGVGGGYYTYY